MSKERELLQRLVDACDTVSDWYEFGEHVDPLIEDARALLAQEQALQELADQAQAQGWYDDSEAVKQSEVLGALQYARTHLYAAQAQMIPGDDSIIMRHVYDAYRRVADVCREIELHGISRLGPIKPPKS